MSTNPALLFLITHSFHHIKKFFYWFQMMQEQNQQGDKSIRSDAFEGARRCHGGGTQLRSDILDRGEVLHLEL